MVKQGTFNPWKTDRYRQALPIYCPIRLSARSLDFHSGESGAAPLWDTIFKTKIINSLRGVHTIY
jgi:hypothetical protein